MGTDRQTIGGHHVQGGWQQIPMRHSGTGRKQQAFLLAAFAQVVPK
jgi:hypothetical protein